MTSKLFNSSVEVLATIKWHYTYIKFSLRHFNIRTKFYQSSCTDLQTTEIAKNI